MSSEAYDQVSMWRRNGVSLERALQELRNHIADNPREQEWKKSPDLWRRYMQTMARVVQEIYQNELAMQNDEFQDVGQSNKVGIGLI